MRNVLKIAIICSLAANSVYPQSDLEERFKVQWGAEVAKAHEALYDFIRPDVRTHLTENDYTHYRTFRIAPKNNSPSVQRALDNIKATQDRTRDIGRYAYPLLVRVDKTSRQGDATIIHYAAAQGAPMVVNDVVNRYKGAPLPTKGQVVAATRESISKRGEMRWVTGTSEAWIKMQGEWYLAAPTPEQAESILAQVALMKRIDQLEHPKDRAQISALCEKILALDPDHKEARRYYENSKSQLAMERGFKTQKEKGALWSEIRESRYQNFPHALQLYEQYLQKFPDDVEKRDGFAQWKAEHERAWEARQLKDLKRKVRQIMPRKQFAEYKTLCERYMALAPDDKEVLSSIGSVLWDMIVEDADPAIELEQDRVFRQAAYDYYFQLFPDDTRSNLYFDQRFKEIYQ